ncbi:hypothetical protein [Roseicyclus elongatus]|uniref:hypothetical protein n=1 Tax=Roseicyclus elongatus TaxID=159346 RepID=UPI0004B245B9
MTARDLQDATFEALFDTDQDGAQTLSDKAAEAEKGNALRHVISLSMTKLADGFIDPKLVLSWLVGALGAPALFVGLLVPIREAGALLPQLFSAGWVQAQRRRKWIWAAGSLTQGLAAAGIVLAALLLQGWGGGRGDLRASGRAGGGAVLLLGQLQGHPGPQRGPDAARHGDGAGRVGRLGRGDRLCGLHAGRAGGRDDRDFDRHRGNGGAVGRGERAVFHLA